MTDPFTDVADELMTRSTDLGSSEVAPPPPPAGAKTKKHVCPYCGAVTAVVEKPTGPCPRCSMEDTPATRAATKTRIGPWYVLQTRNPSAPGMKWATLLSLVSKGQVTPRSVVRGPTTHQLWKFAAHVKGLSREFNLCYSCGGEIERTVNQCAHCDRLQEPPVNPDALLESRELGPRNAIHKEIKPQPTPQPTDMVLAGAQNDELARRQRNPDDGILSAKELAAAFQLDFNPQNGQPEPMMMPITPPLQRRRPGRAFAILLLLAAIAGGTLLYIKPDYREKTRTWLSNTFTSIKNSLEPSKPAAQPMPWEANTKKAEADYFPAPAPAPAPAAEKVEPAPAPAPITVAEIKPENKIEAPAPAPEPPVAVEKPKPPVEQKPPAAQVDSNLSDSERARILWSKAIDAEIKQDMPEAVGFYEQIKKLDPAVWPKTLEMRLKEAQRKLPAK